MIKLLILVFQPAAFSQVPTEQDCLGAIPICQSIYHETSSFTGSGNYTNEIDPVFSCLANEDNSVWYIFTAQTSGMLSFIITPEDTLDDWDWAVYDLSNASCQDIFSNQALQLSCNSYGNFTGWYNGPTGANSAMGGTTNNNGPGTANGPPWNADIPVFAGGTYVMLICNWTGSTFGYTLDMSSSTAKIFDDVPPLINYIDTPVVCGATNLNIRFSEKILCNTISASDFILRCPQINHNISGVVGNACAQGGTQEKDFSINFTPPIIVSGKYVFELIDIAGSVTDLCNNIAPPDSLVFFVSDITATIVNIIHASCEQNNGSATVNGSGGNGIYTYLWSTNPPQTSQTALDLGAGIYYVSVSSGGCMGIDSVEIHSSPIPFVSISPQNSWICSGDSITLYVDKGFVSYSWNDGMASSDTLVISLAGFYYVSIIDSLGCVGMSDTVEISLYPAPEIVINPIDPVICKGDEIVLTASGANTYNWFPFTTLSGSTGSVIIANPLNSTVYSIEGTDDRGCKNYVQIKVEVIPWPQIFSKDSAWVCGGSTLRLKAGNTYSSYIWQDGSHLSYYDVIYPGTYWVSVDHLGCIATDTIFINACSEIWIPNTFTPNGDGKNDIFKAVGSGNIKVFKIVIFNRWGANIFESDNINIGWDGKYQGSLAPEGIYNWYIIYQPTGNIDTEKESRAGHVTLLR